MISRAIKVTTKSLIKSIQAGPVIHYLHDPNTPELVKEISTSTLPNLSVIGYEGGGFPSGSLQNQAASVLATIVDSLNGVNGNTDKKMNKWARVNTLLVLPRAGRMFNAYYDRRTLSFFFDKDVFTGQDVYSADSAEVVAHELGHAIFDFYRPDLWNLAYIEFWAFHEAFGDLNAFFSNLYHDEIINYALKETNNDLRTTNIACQMAEQLGRAIYAYAPEGGRDQRWLRNLSNDFRYVNPATLPHDGPDNVLCAEPHNFSRVFSGAVYDIFVMMYKEIAKNLPLVDAIKKARDILQGYLIKSIQNVPATPTFYESMARTILWCDWSLPNKPFHDKMFEIFVQRNIIKPVTALFLPPPEPISLKTIKVGEHLQTLTALYHNPLYHVEVDVSDHGAEAVEAAHHMITYLHETQRVGPLDDTPFDIANGKLVRSFFACCGNPSKFQPEFLKPFKPENNAGCNCGRKPPTPVEKTPRVHKCCSVRYQVQK